MIPFLFDLREDVYSEFYKANGKIAAKRHTEDLGNEYNAYLVYLEIADKIEPLWLEEEIIKSGHGPIN